MRTETFYQELPVKLTDEERRLRAQQASRAWPALAKQEAAIVDKKAEQKAALATMETDKMAIITTARTAAFAAENGEEPRKVECREEIVGAVVLTIRLDTGETVRDRPATEQEIRGEQKRAEEEQRKRPNGYTPAEMTQKLAAAIAKLCEKPREVKWVLKQLATGTPESTEADRRGAFKLALDEGRIEEEEATGRVRNATKLPSSPPTDDGSVPNDYDPAQAH